MRVTLTRIPGCDVYAVFVLVGRSRRPTRHTGIIRHILAHVHPHRVCWYRRDRPVTNDAVVEHVASRLKPTRRGALVVVVVVSDHCCFQADHDDPLTTTVYHRDSERLRTR